MLQNLKLMCISEKTSILFLIIKKIQIYYDGIFHYFNVFPYFIFGVAKAIQLFISPFLHPCFYFFYCSEPPKQKFSFLRYNYKNLTNIITNNFILKTLPWGGRLWNDDYFIWSILLGVLQVTRRVYWINNKLIIHIIIYQSKCLCDLNSNF